MRCLILAVFLLVSATAVHGANDAPRATGIIEGQKVKFPEKGIAEGVKATVGLLESCCDESLFQAAELQKARQGDHIRLVFPTPISVTVMRDKLDVSEVIFSRGVFWLQSRNTFRRYSKYRFEKVKPFEEWRQQAQPDRLRKTLDQTVLVGEIDVQRTADDLRKGRNTAASQLSAVMQHLAR
jgi:hypothetical protein